MPQRTLCLTFPRSLLGLKLDTESERWEHQHSNSFTLPEQVLQGLRRPGPLNGARVMDGVTAATRVIQSAQARGKGREPERDGEAKSEEL